MSSRNNSDLKCSADSDEFADRSRSSWCHKSWCRLLFVLILSLLSIGSTTSLLIVLYKDALKEKTLAEKKKGWIDKWKVIQPYVKKFPLGFVLGFIRNLIVLAIDRQSEVQ